MEFIHRHYQPGETIAAISTPPGEGGISIIRISGHRAIEVASRLFSGDPSSYLTHTVHYGSVSDSAGNRLDDALLLVMRAPKSYTGEDTIELQCHGGMIASKKVLEATLAAGARAAMPGEFTFKAFMNGKIDLAQAEAVQQLIGAKNEQAFAVAGKQLEGALSKKIESFQRALIHWAAICEAWVDFPEEGLEFTTQEEIEEGLKNILNEMTHLVNTFEEGRRCTEGISLCIVGSPNAGKSSLMNALLNQDRAIVTPIAGTTRDLLHEELTIGGLHFTLTDTAGIRETEESIEREGIRRTKEAIKTADLILLVLDGTEEMREGELFPLLPQEKTIALCNKADHPHYSLCQTPFPHTLSISAKEGTGLEELKKVIERSIWQNGVPPRGELLVTSLRHKESLLEAIAALQSTIKGLCENVSPEFLIVDLRACLTALGRIIGNNISEAILSSIFSQFCIGK